jgi:3,4-dihydroxy 2-butanone 4-phosphate synthase/GTP cyclohydrolase II
LQDAGFDTVDANLAQGLPADSREYGIGAQILLGLGVRRIRLMTNNPAKCRGLSGHGVRIIDREPLVVAPNADSSAHLTTKQARLTTISVLYVRSGRRCCPRDAANCRGGPRPDTGVP